MSSKTKANKQKLPPTWLLEVINSLRLWLMRLYYRLTPAKMAVFEKSQGFWIAKSIGVACELDLADHIGNEKISIEEIALRAHCKEEPLYRLMRTLAGEGIFREYKNKHFKNTAFSRALMDGENSMKHMIQHQINNTNWAVINELKYTVTSAKPAASKVLGMGIFEHLEKDEEKNKLYNKAMTNTSSATAQAILSAYDFSNTKVLADVGGGKGHLLTNILIHNPTLEGIIFDLEHVAGNAEEIAATHGLGSRLKTYTGDFFEGLPFTADRCMLKNILHAFNDEKCIEILRQLAQVIGPQNGKLLIIETVINPDNKPAFGKLLDLQMLIGTENGKERTLEEFDALMNASGLVLDRCIKTITPFCIIECSLKE